MFINRLIPDGEEFRSIRILGHRSKVVSIVLGIKFTLNKSV